MSSVTFFTVEAQLPDGRGRSGVIHTPHGEIRTPAFIAVGTKATVKAVLPETMRDLGAQAVLANQRSKIALIRIIFRMTFSLFFTSGRNH